MINLKVSEAGVRICGRKRNRALTGAAARPLAAPALRRLAQEKVGFLGSGVCLAKSAAHPFSVRGAQFALAARPAWLQRGAGFAAGAAKAGLAAAA